MCIVLMSSIAFTAGCTSQHQDARDAAARSPGTCCGLYPWIRLGNGDLTEELDLLGWSNVPGCSTPSPQQVLTVKTWEQDVGSQDVHYGLQH